MFTALKNHKIIACNETGNFPCLVYDEIKETENMELVEVNGEFAAKNSVAAIAKMQADVRSCRNSYLSETDKYMISDYPLSEEERQSVKAYREYLRDYTLNEKWWQTEPLAYAMWSR